MIVLRTHIHADLLKKSSEMDVLYIEGRRSPQDADNIEVTIQSALTLLVSSYCKSNLQHFKILSCEHKHDIAGWQNTTLVQLGTHIVDTFEMIEHKDEEPCPVLCELPAVKEASGRKTLSGLGCVLRRIVRTSSLKHQYLADLLGFKQVCFKACAEVSAWTKFCEVEMPNAVKKVIGDLRKNETPAADVLLPLELLKLEKQFSEPVAVAYKNKRRRQLRKLQEGRTRIVDGNPEHFTDSDQTLKQPAACKAEGSVEQLVGVSQAKKDDIKSCPELEHTYVEGPDFTLADLVLFPCVSLILCQWRDILDHLVQYLPKTLEWYSKVCAMPSVQQSMLSVGLPIHQEAFIKQLLQKDLGKTQLSSRIHLPSGDASQLKIREVNRKRFKTSDSEIRRVTNKMKANEVEDTVSEHPAEDVRLPWWDMPAAVHPRDGDLPADRLERKCQQLENLASAVTMMVKPDDVIVDFCSGGGHLGILLAHLCPQSQIILVENKEESIQKAEARIEKLGLKNIQIYHCNLGYFYVPFDIGVCLHACGVATDLVMQSCLDNQASFVICPCCYGGIQNTHTLSYPRSQKFRDIDVSYEDFLILGHTADQTEFNLPTAAIGKRSMVYIDNDRMSVAKEQGYNVTLCTLSPPTCSPKNNLLIGKRGDGQFEI